MSLVKKKLMQGKQLFLVSENDAGEVIGPVRDKRGRRHSSRPSLSGAASGPSRILCTFENWEEVDMKVTELRKATAAEARGFQKPKKRGTKRRLSMVGDPNAFTLKNPRFTKLLPSLLLFYGDFVCTPHPFFSPIVFRRCLLVSAIDQFCVPHHHHCSIALNVVLSQ